MTEKLSPPKGGLGCLIWLVALVLIGFGLAMILNQSERGKIPKKTKITNQQIRKQSRLKTQRGKTTKEPAAISPRIRKIIGAAYSYQAGRWAGYRGFATSRYPRVSLSFSSGLLVGPSMRWNGKYSIERDQICLIIDDLKLPRSGGVLEAYYEEFGVGYYVELEEAVFADNTIGRNLLLFRSFLGDTPPKHIQKCFDLIKIEQSTIVQYKIDGEWEGIFNATEKNGAKSETRFVLRLVQTGNKFTGSSIDFPNKDEKSKKKTKRRARIEGWIRDGKVTFIKKYEKQPFGVNYVATYSKGSQKLSGLWYWGQLRNKWKMYRTGDFVGTPDEILGINPSNPPQRKTN